MEEVACERQVGGAVVVRTLGFARRLWVLRRRGCVLGAVGED